MNIYDIAKEAGVSASTVSRVINDRPGIKAETREKVRRLLKKFDYAPNDNARGLVTRSSRTVGILIPDIRELNHMTCAFTMQGEFSANGYCSLILNTGESLHHIAEYMRVMRQRQVDGVMMIGSFFQRPDVGSLVEEYLGHVPVVMANATLDLPNVSSVMMDEVTGVASMVDRLWNKGRRRLAFVTTEKRIAASERKLEGFRQAMRRLCPQEEPRIYCCDNSPEGGYRVALNIMEEHPEIDGILFSWDLEATGALRALIDKGIRIPEQVAVTGVDNSLYCELCYPRLTSVDVKPHDMCVAAARTMLDLLTGNETVRRLVIPPSLVERETT